MFYNSIGIAVVLLLTAGFAFAGCSENADHDPKAGESGHMHGQNGEPMQHQGEKADPPEMGGMEGMKQGDSGHMHGSETEDDIFTADTLYTCPMHPEVVSTDAGEKCPLCNMNLTAMPGEKVKELRVSHPKGCPMCPIVVEGDSEMDTCPVCNMKLNELDRESKKGKMKHSSMLTPHDDSDCACG